MVKRILLIALFVMVGCGLASGAPVEKEFPFKKTTTLAYPKTYQFRFSLYPEETGGVAVWTEEKSINLVSAVIKTSLGDSAPLDDVDFSQQYWVQVERWKPATSSWITVGVRDKLAGVVPYAMGSYDAPAVTSYTPGIWSAELTTSMNTMIFSKIVTPPSTGYLLVTATGTVATTHTSGTQGFICVDLADTVTTFGCSPGSGTKSAMRSNIDSELPTGGYDASFTLMEVYPAIEGVAQTFYVNGYSTGLSQTYILHPTLTILFVPNALP